MLPSDRLVDDLADAILDGTPIDWKGAESSSEGTRRPLLRQLRVLAAVAEVHRGPPPSTSTPEHWGHLRLLEQIGRGTFGEVYRAWDTRLDREVALKLLPAGPSSRDRAASAIINEGRLLARVRHPNVVTIYGAEQIADQIGLWMEFVRGHTLEQILDQRKVVSTAEAVGIGLELCRAMAAVHGAGLLHRDIKTHNVMRAEDGRIVLMDFGSWQRPRGRCRVGSGRHAPLSRTRGTAGTTSHGSERLVQFRRPPLSPRHRLVSSSCTDATRGPQCAPAR